MPMYILLQPLSPEAGPVLLPAPPAAEGEPPAAPVLVDEAMISAEAAPLLIAGGIIAPYAPEQPGGNSEIISAAAEQPALEQPEAQAELAQAEGPTTNRKRTKGD